MQRAVAAAALAALLALAGCSTTTTSPVQESREAGGVPEPVDAERRARVRLELASAYFARGQTNVALDELNQALQAKPDLPEAHNLRGLILGAMGDEAQAEASFKRALQLNPRDGDAMHNYGWLLCQQRRHADADAQFQRALELPRYANGARTLMAQGICQARDGRLDAAEAALARSYELDPANPVTAVNLSEVLLRRGQYQRARFYIRRVNSQPEVSNAQTLWLATRIEHKLDNAAGVAEFGKQLRDRFPRSPEAQALERGRFDE